MKQIKKNLLTMTAILLCGGILSCSDDSDVPGEDNTPKEMDVQVTTSSVLTKALVTGEYLSDRESIGVKLVDATNSTYDGLSFDNIKYTASGVGTSQKWEAASTVLLSSTIGTVYAYYPYKDGTDITNISISSGQTDFMYGFATGVTNATATANVKLNHALVAIKAKIIKGDYTAKAELTDISIVSTGLATNASLNAMTGALTKIQGANTNINWNGTQTLQGSSTDILLAGVPTAATNPSIKFSLTIDGAKYNINSTYTGSYIPGNVYEYTLTLNGKELLLTGITVSTWKIEDKGSLAPMP
jgi:hypothetical protein